MQIFNKIITRTPDTSMVSGLTTASLGKPDLEKAMTQFENYVKTLDDIVGNVIQMPPLPEAPDAHFVEDTAVIIPGLAIICNPGTPTRKIEVPSMKNLLSDMMPIAEITHPGELDGGDVLFIDKNVYIGISERTNEEGAEQLCKLLSRYGYSCNSVHVDEGLHLKSSVNYLGNDTILFTSDFESYREFQSYDCISVIDNEKYAANTLLVNDVLLTPAGFPDTLHKLRSFSNNIISLDMSEMQKVDGGLSCLSLRIS